MGEVYKGEPSMEATCNFNHLRLTERETVAINLQLGDFYQTPSRHEPLLWLRGENVKTFRGY